MHRLQSVSTGRPHPIPAKSGVTGHFKDAQDSARITTHGLVGDHISDTANHGGPDQAVYLLGEADQQWWSRALGQILKPGYMGENLVISGLASADLALGDTLEIGEVRLQITAPRIPCVTFAARIGRPDGVKMFRASGHPGAYARVLQEGDVTPQMPVTHRPFGGDRISVAAHLEAYSEGINDAAYLQRLLEIPAHAAIHADVRRRLADGGTTPI